MRPVRVQGPGLLPDHHQMETLDLSLGMSQHKSTLQDLNSRLSSYIHQVRCLEAANQTLEQQIEAELQRKSPVELKHLDTHLASASRLQEQIEVRAWEVAVLKLQFLAAELAVFDFRTRCEQEGAERGRIEAGLKDLRQREVDLEEEVNVLEQEVSEKEAERRIQHQQHLQDMQGLQDRSDGLSIEVRNRTGDSDLVGQLQSVSWSRLTLPPLLDSSHPAKQVEACVCEEESELLELTTTVASLQRVLDQLRTENSHVEAEAVQHMEAVEELLQLFGLDAARLCDELQTVLDASENQTHLTASLHQNIAALRAELQRYQELLQETEHRGELKMPSSRSFKATSVRLTPPVPHPVSPMSAPRGFRVARVGHMQAGQSMQRLSGFVTTSQHDIKVNKPISIQGETTAARSETTTTKMETVKKTKEDGSTVQINGDIVKPSILTADSKIVSSEATNQSKKEIPNVKYKASVMRVSGIDRIQDMRSATEAKSQGLWVETMSKTIDGVSKPSILTMESKLVSSDVTNQSKNEQGNAKDEASVTRVNGVDKIQEVRSTMEAKSVCVETSKINGKIDKPSTLTAESRIVSSEVTNQNKNELQNARSKDNMAIVRNSDNMQQAKEIYPNLKVETTSKLNREVDKLSTVTMNSKEIGSDMTNRSKNELGNAKYEANINIVCGVDKTQEVGSATQEINKILSKTKGGLGKPSTLTAEAKIVASEVTNQRKNELKNAKEANVTRANSNDKTQEVRSSVEVESQSLQVERLSKTNGDTDKVFTLKAESKVFAHRELAENKSQNAKVEANVLKINSYDKTQDETKSLSTVVLPEDISSTVVQGNNYKLGVETAKQIKHDDINVQPNLKEGRKTKEELVKKEFQEAKVEANLEPKVDEQEAKIRTESQVQNHRNDRIKPEGITKAEYLDEGVGIKHDILKKESILSSKNVQGSKNIGDSELTTAEVLLFAETEQILTKTESEIPNKIIEKDSVVVPHSLHDLPQQNAATNTKKDPEISSGSFLKKTAENTGAKRKENIVIVKIIEEIHNSMSKTTTELQQNQVVWSSEFNVQKAAENHSVHPDPMGETRVNVMGEAKVQSSEVENGSENFLKSPENSFIVLKVTEEIKESVRKTNVKAEVESENCLNELERRDTEGENLQESVEVGMVSDSKISAVTEEHVRGVKDDADKDFHLKICAQNATEKQLTKEPDLKPKVQSFKVETEQISEESKASCTENAVVDSKCDEKIKNISNKTIADVQVKQDVKAGVNMNLTGQDFQAKVWSSETENLMENPTKPISAEFEITAVEIPLAEKENDSIKIVSYSGFKCMESSESEKQTVLSESCTEKQKATTDMVLIEKEALMGVNVNQKHQAPQKNSEEELKMPQTVSAFESLRVKIPQISKALSDTVLPRLRCANANFKIEQNVEFPKSLEEDEEFLRLDEGAFFPQDLEEFGDEDLTEANVHVRPVERYILKESLPLSDFDEVEATHEVFRSNRGDVPVGQSAAGSSQVVDGGKEKETDFGGLYRVKTTGKLMDGARASNEKDEQIVEKKDKASLADGEENSNERNGERFEKNDVNKWMNGNLEINKVQTENETSEMKPRGGIDEKKVFENIHKAEELGDIGQKSETSLEERATDKPSVAMDVPKSEGSLDTPFSPPASECRVYGRSSGRMSTSPPKNLSPKTPLSMSPPEARTLFATSPPEMGRIGALYGGTANLERRTLSPGRFRRQGSGEWLVYGHSRERMSTSTPGTHSPTATSPMSPTETGRFGKAGSGEWRVYGNQERISRPENEFQMEFRPQVPRPMSPTETGPVGKAGSEEWRVYGQNRDRLSQSVTESLEFRSRAQSPSARPMSPTETGRFQSAGSGEWHVYGQNRDRMSQPEHDDLQFDFRALSPEEMVNSGAFFGDFGPDLPKADLGRFNLSPRQLSPPPVGPYGRFGKADSGEWLVYGNSSSTGRLSKSASDERLGVFSSRAMSPVASGENMKQRPLSPDGGRFARADGGEWMVYRSLSPPKTETGGKLFDLRKQNLSPPNLGRFEALVNKDWLVYKNISSKDGEKMRKRALSPPEVQRKLLLVRGEGRKSNRASGRNIISSLGKLVKSAKGGREPGSVGGRVITSSDGPIKSSDSATATKKERISVCKMTAMSLSRERSHDKKNKDTGSERRHRPQKTCKVPETPASKITQPRYETHTVPLFPAAVDVPTSL